MCVGLCAYQRARSYSFTNVCVFVLRLTARNTQGRYPHTACSLLVYETPSTGKGRRRRRRRWWRRWWWWLSSIAFGNSLSIVASARPRILAACSPSRSLLARMQRVRKLSIDLCVYDRVRNNNNNNNVPT